MAVWRGPSVCGRATQDSGYRGLQAEGMIGWPPYRALLNLVKALLDGSNLLLEGWLEAAVWLGVGLRASVQIARRVSPFRGQVVRGRRRGGVGPGRQERTRRWRAGDYCGEHFAGVLGAGGVEE